MKSAWVSTALVLAIITTFAIGCDKDDAVYTPPAPPPSVGGKGGDATLLVTPIHDSLYIDSCKVYIKYDAPVIPFNNVYDDSAVCVQIDGKPTAKFTDLKAGEYYLFGNGWDIIRSEKVRGGMPYVIVDSNKATYHTTVLPIQDYQ